MLSLRCCNHLRLLNITSNGQLGQLRSRVIVKHQTPAGRRAAGSEDSVRLNSIFGVWSSFPNLSQAHYWILASFR